MSECVSERERWVGGVWDGDQLTTVCGMWSEQWWTCPFRTRKQVELKSSPRSGRDTPHGSTLVLPRSHSTHKSCDMFIQSTVVVFSSLRCVLSQAQPVITPHRCSCRAKWSICWRFYRWFKHDNNNKHKPFILELTPAHFSSAGLALEPRSKLCLDWR